MNGFYHRTAAPVKFPHGEKHGAWGWHCQHGHGGRDWGLLERYFACYTACMSLGGWWSMRYWKFSWVINRFPCTQLSQVQIFRVHQWKWIFYCAFRLDWPVWLILPLLLWRTLLFFHFAKWWELHYRKDLCYGCSVPCQWWVHLKDKGCIAMTHLWVGTEGCTPSYTKCSAERRQISYPAEQGATIGASATYLVDLGPQAGASDGHVDHLCALVRTDVIQCCATAALAVRNEQLKSASQTLEKGTEEH